MLELTPPEMVSCAIDAGFDGVGLRIIPATPQEVQHPMVGDTPLVRESERRLKDTGLRVLDVEIFRLRPDTVIADYEAALATGARFGATEALIAGNDPDEARLIVNFAAFCELAQQFGIGGNREPMPWTDCKNFAQGARIVTAAAHAPAKFPVSRTRFRYMQLCDAPAERPTDIEGLLHQARAERLMPGDGGLDLTGILRALPADLPIGLEIPMETLAKTVPAVERTKEMLAKTRRLLASLE